MLQSSLTPRVCDYVQKFAGSFRTRFSRNRFSSLGLWTVGQTASLRTYTLAFGLQFSGGMREKKGAYSIEHQSCCLDPSKTDILFRKLRYYFLLYLFICLFIYLFVCLFVYSCGEIFIFENWLVKDSHHVT